MTLVRRPPGTVAECCEPVDHHPKPPLQLWTVESQAHVEPSEVAHQDVQQQFAEAVFKVLVHSGSEIGEPLPQELHCGFAIESLAAAFFRHCDEPTAPSTHALCAAPFACLE